MPAQRERDVVRELERALRHGVCGTKKVGPGDELVSSDQHDDAGKGRVRETVVPEPFVTQDQLVRPAAVHQGPPGETRGLRRRAVLLADGGQPVVAEAATGDRAGNVADQAGIEKVATRGVRIVVRHFEMTAAANLRGDLREQVLGRHSPIHRAQRARVQGVGVGEDALEPHRARVRNADARKIRSACRVADERAAVLHRASLEVGARAVQDRGPLISDTARGADLARIGISYASAMRFERILADTYALNPGTLGAVNGRVPAQDLFAKVTAQIGGSSHLEVSHHYAHAARRNFLDAGLIGYVPGAITSRGFGYYGLSSVGEEDRTTAQTSRLTWRAQVNSRWSNELILSYEWLRDHCLPN